MNEAHKPHSVLVVNDANGSQWVPRRAYLDLEEQYEESRAATQKWYDEAHDKRRENARLLEQLETARLRWLRAESFIDHLDANYRYAEWVEALTVGTSNPASSPQTTERQLQASVERIMQGRGLNYDQVRDPASEPEAK